VNEIELIKKPQLDYIIHPLLSSRWSPRAFNPRPLEPEKLQRIFEAARWSASASNLQPWFFMVGLKGDEVYAKIFATLVEFNQLWAINAPVLVFAVTKTTNPKGEPNKYAAYDLGQAVAMLSLQAKEEGIHIHQMGGFDADEAALALEVPEDCKVMVAIAIGYRGEAEILHPNLLKLERSPRSRKATAEFVFAGSFGQKADFL
jgi:nitroreductase